MSNINTKFTEHIIFLKKIASTSDISYKHAAALIDNNNMYSYGSNYFIKTFYDVKPNKTNEIKKHFKTIHAEISVLSKIPRKSIKGLNILVIRINTKSDLKNSRPCNHCIDKLNKMGIRKVFYSNENGDIVNEFTSDMKKLHISAGHRFMNRISYV